MDESRTPLKVPDMEEFLARIDRKTTGNRCDVTPLFADANAFAALVEHLLGQIAPFQFDRVAGIDALGFILGTAIAVRLTKGFIALRKGGKLPLDCEHCEFVDYTNTTKTLEVRRDVLHPGERILLVDEWIETGAQIRAAIALIERLGGVIAGIATINIDAEAAASLTASGYRTAAASSG